METPTLNLPFPAEFTIEELEKLRELAMRAGSLEQSHLLHNLGVKCSNYLDTARHAMHRLS